MIAAPLPSVSGLPVGYHSLTAYLTPSPAWKAIEWYKNAFGAIERMRFDEGPEGRVHHAELIIGDSVLMLADACDTTQASTDNSAPKGIGFNFYVPNVQEAFDKAVKAGAKVKESIGNRHYGDRSGNIIDPFGYGWTISTRVENLTNDEIKKRGADADKTYTNNEECCQGAAKKVKVDSSNGSSSSSNVIIEKSNKLTLPAVHIAKSIDEWNSAREQLRLLEKAHTASLDKLNAERVKLPWLKVDNTIKLEGADGECNLSSLFGDKKVLLVYNCMTFTDTPCGRCTGLIDEFNGVAPHLSQHAALAVIARCPPDRFQVLKRMKQWSIPVYACKEDYTTFIGSENHEKCKRYGPKASRPGISVYSLGNGKDKNNVYLTYSSFDRGVEELEIYLAWLDRLPCTVPRNIRQPANFNWEKFAPDNIY